MNLGGGVGARRTSLGVGIHRREVVSHGDRAAERSSSRRLVSVSRADRTDTLCAHAIVTRGAFLADTRACCTESGAISTRVAADAGMSAHRSLLIFEKNKIRRSS